MDIYSKAYVRAVQLLNGGSKPPRFASATAERGMSMITQSLLLAYSIAVYNLAKDLDPLSAKYHELYQHYVTRCESAAVQNGLLNTSADLIDAVHDLQNAARRYEYLVKRQDGLYEYLEATSNKPT